MFSGDPVCIWYFVKVFEIVFLQKQISLWWSIPFLRRPAPNFAGTKSQQTQIEL